MQIQSVLIDKDIYTLEEAIDFLNDYGLSHKKVDITDNYYRFRQIPPNKKYFYQTKNFAKGIKIIMV